MGQAKEPGDLSRVRWHSWHSIAARLALEFLFWAPLWLVPMAARHIAGDRFALKDVVVSVSLSAALWVIGTYLGRFQPAYRLIVYVVLGLGSLFVTGMALTNNGLLNPLTALAIIDTNRSEATEFVTGAFGTRDILLCSLLIVPLLALVVQISRGLLFGRVRFAGIAVLALLAAQIGAADVANYRDKDLTPEATGAKGGLAYDRWAYLKYPADRYPSLQPYYALLSAIQMRSEIARLGKSTHPLQGVRAVEQQTGKPRAYVVVVGESLARHHMHLYGYPRDTTPELDRLAATGDLLVFRHVVTSHALTVPALMSIFRFPTDRGHDGQTAFDIFNGGGFTTYWISNQYQAGTFESAVSLLTASASKHAWLHSPMQGRYEERRNFDTVVLKPLENIIQSEAGDKVIFIHLLGNHFYYRARFPDSATYFGGRQGSSCRTSQENQYFNDYDDSVRFNDSLMGQIIATMKKFDGESLVLYFSDHGEEVYDWREFFDHGDSMLSPYLAEIPFVLWLSDAYRSAHPSFSAQVARALDRPFITSDLIDAMPDLMRLTFPGMDESRSLFSDKFKPHQRITADRDYDSFKAEWRPDTAHSEGAKLLKCTDMADSEIGVAGAPAQGPESGRAR
jgi:glucan phosphoethanolaminetransferase (alkaline phosphatase superfamily)